VRWYASTPEKKEEDDLDCEDNEVNLPPELWKYVWCLLVLIPKGKI
jgi:hypothetical protein